MNVDVKIPEALPAESEEFKKYLRARRRSLLQEVNWIELHLDEPLTVRAECPQCRSRWNKKAE